MQDSLYADIQQRSQRALQQGALSPIDTRRQLLDDAGLPFELRVIDGLNSKRKARRAQAKRPGFNPFADPDPALRVMDLAPAHRLLLNKFPVFAQHLLVVTRDFAPQTAPLTRDDFIALCHVLRALGGLAFYNGGRQAGASQKHKHLQLIPQQALRQNDAQATGESRLLSLLWPGLQAGTHRFGAYPFAHHARPFAAQLRQLLQPQADEPDDANERCAEMIFTHYQQALRALQLNPDSPAPYNLCVTRQGLLLVARRQDEVRGVSINALGYAGFFLARNDDEQNRIRKTGPMQMLIGAALSAG